MFLEGAKAYDWPPAGSDNEWTAHFRALCDNACSKRVCQLATVLLCRPYGQTTRAEYIDAVRYLESVRGLAPPPPEAGLSLHNEGAAIDEALDE
jgi:hypothetical protein